MSKKYLSLPVQFTADNGEFVSIRINKMSNFLLHRFCFSQDKGAIKGREDYPDQYKQALEVANKRGIKE